MDADLDAQIRGRFLNVYEAACAGELDDWRQAPKFLLALIIVSINSPGICSKFGTAFAADPPCGSPRKAWLKASIAPTLHNGMS
jgi:uncharacterized protein (DUF924 family)